MSDAVLAPLALLSFVVLIRCIWWPYDWRGRRKWLNIKTRRRWFD